MKKKLRYEIIRTYSAGVFFGQVSAVKGDEITIDNCRRLWYWSGSASLSQMAVEGVKNPSECKFSVRTNGHTVKGWIERIPVTDEAEKILNGVPEWKN